MKAVQTSQYGKPSVLELKDNVEEPTAKAIQVLIEVHAAGLNPFDVKVLSGAYQQSMPLDFPVTFGGDVAGVIREVGDEITDLKPGDEVYGSAMVISGGSGAFAELATISANKVALKPKNTDFIQAAALPVAGMTAVEAIVDHIKLQKGQKILIHGGAGGVGHVAIQQAKALGAYVITTASAKDTDFVTQLGADEVIDYKTQQFEEELSDLDAVLVSTAADVAAKSYQILKPGGTLLLLSHQVDEQLAEKYNVNAIRQGSDTTTPNLQRLARLVEDGTIAVRVDKVFPLDQVHEAYDHLAHGHPQGKVMLRVK